MKLLRFSGDSVEAVRYDDDEKRFVLVRLSADRDEIEEVKTWAVPLGTW